jgi:hypothetical protein
MVTRLKSTQVQQEFGEIMDRAISGAEIIVERYGAPRVAIIEYQRYQQLIEAERQLMRSRLQKASEAASARAAHLTDKEVDDLIERARSESRENRNS